MNGEVEIICLSDSARIPDLGLSMTRGSRMNVSVSNASRSRDLELAKAQGIVAVREIKVSVLRTIQGSSMSKTEDENLKKVQRTALNWSGPNQSSEVTDFLLAIKELTKEISALRSDLAQRPPSAPVPVVDTSAVTEALRVALSGISVSSPLVSSPRTQVSLSPDEERFIPSGIVPTNLKADISPNTTNEGAGSLEDAQAALREARRRARET